MSSSSVDDAAEAASFSEAEAGDQDDNSSNINTDASYSAEPMEVESSSAADNSAEDTMEVDTPQSTNDAKDGEAVESINNINDVEDANTAPSSVNSIASSSCAPSITKSDISYVPPTLPEKTATTTSHPNPFTNPANPSSPSAQTPPPPRPHHPFRTLPVPRTRLDPNRPQAKCHVQSEQGR
eukprot:g7439.t1 g7439   contig24:625820-626365(-)